MDGKSQEPNPEDRIRGSLEHAFASWRPMLEGFLRKNAPRDLLARESAADLAQSVFREALDRIERGDLEYRGEPELRRWLFRASELKLQNRQRYWAAARRAGQRAGGAPELLSDPELRSRLHARMKSPSSVAIRGEDAARFEQALEGLDERQRAVVALFYLEDLRHAEIAERLGIEESHSRTVLARALARLARVLSE